VAASLQSVISSAAGAEEQGATMGAVSSLSSLMAVIAPLVGPPLLALVAHYPKGDWRIGAPMYLCALLQGMALLLAWWHFRSARAARPAIAPAE